MNNRIKFLIILVVSIFLFGFLSIESSPGQVSSPTPPPNLSQDSYNSDILKNAEISILQAQLEVMRQYDQRLLNTVFWSLGTVGAIILGLTALNWYNNNRLYEKDKDAIRRELELNIKEEIIKIKDSFQNEIKEQFNSLNEATQKSVLKSIQGLESDLSDFDNKVNDLNLKIKLMEALKWEEKGVYRNVFTNSIEIIEEANSMNIDSYPVEKALDLLQNSIRMKRIKGDTLGAYDLANLKKALDKLPDEYENVIKTIYQRIEEPIPPQATSIG